MGDKVEKCIGAKGDYFEGDKLQFLRGILNIYSTVIIYTIPLLF